MLIKSLIKRSPILFLCMLLICVLLSGEVCARDWQDYYRTSTLLLEKDNEFLRAELKALNKSQPEMPLSAKTFGFDVDQPIQWFKTPEGRRVMDIVLSFQTPSGGWSKRTDMATEVRQKGQAFGVEQEYIPTFDNDATSTQMNLLAKAFTATGEKKYQLAFDRGFEFILTAQYPNGGWPQNFPLRGGYHDLITYNDNLMRDLMLLLKQVSEGKHEFSFTSSAQRQQAKAGLDLAIDCVLKTQVTVNGKLTVWGGQHDLKNLVPAKARAFEMVALTSLESAYLTELLMELDHPSPEVVKSVHFAVQWFQSTQIRGKFWDRGKVDLVDDPKAKPLWARFYELESNKPIFGDRDNSVHYAIGEISEERRKGYAWYGTVPNRLLEKYSSWKLLHPLQE